MVKAYIPVFEFFGPEFVNHVPQFAFIVAKLAGLLGIVFLDNLFYRNGAGHGCSFA